MQIKHGLSLVAEFVAAVSGIFFFKKLDKRLVYLVYFVCFAFAMEISLNVLADVFELNNNLRLLHFYVPIEFLFLSLTYYRYLVQYIGKIVLLIVIIGFEFFCLLNPIFFQELGEYTNARSISGIILIGFSIVFFHKVMVETKIKKIANEPMVWINTAVLFYFAGNLFYNVLFSFILNYSISFAKITNWYFGVLNVAFYLLIAIAFWKAGKQKVAV